MVDELLVAHVLLAAIAMISCLSVPDNRKIRRMPRTGWVVLIVLVPVAGAIGWFLAGRPLRIGRRPRSRWQDLIGLPAAIRPTGPEDDPGFLRSLHPPAAPGRDPQQGDPPANPTPPSDQPPRDRKPDADAGPADPET